MHLTYDPAKRERTLQERGLDFEDATEVFAGLTLEVEDLRKQYGEKRVLCVGFLRGPWSWWGTRQEGRFATLFL